MQPGAAVDCERILDSWWGQPVNTATALSFVLSGLVIWRLRRDRVTALLVAAVGFGSVAFHGPMPWWGQFAHDLTIAWALVWVIFTEARRRHWWPGAFGAASLLVLNPQAADLTQASLAALALFLVLKARDQRPARLTAAGLLAVGAVVGTLSRTGWPWCRPGAIWQGHGFWHIAAAASLGIWAFASSRPRP
ncbi:MAG: hypothetical protein ACT4OP_05220 [Actinomycetota bacterium]